VLGGRDPAGLLETLQVVHDYERHSPWVFTTLCMATISPDRSTLSLRIAGHPSPLLVSDDGIRSLDGVPADPPLGVVEDATWRAREHPLPDRWSLLLYTDGLIEGRTGEGPERLGDDGLTTMVRGALETPGGDDPAALVAALVEHAEDLNGGPLLDDVAAFVVQRR
jgi:serine phosphatase RsbU (regulator of sigma subunit)